MSKTILAILIGALLISGALYLTMPEEEKSFNELEEEIVIEEGETEENNNIGEEDNDIESEEEGEISSLVDCLADNGVLIYGSRTCPACANLAQGFGGYEAIEKIYVECSEDYDRCGEDKKTGFVPEIQINAELYEGGRSPKDLALAANCEF